MLICKQAKEKWIIKQCEEIGYLEKKDIQMMYAKVKFLARPRTKPGNTTWGTFQ